MYVLLRNCGNNMQNSPTKELIWVNDVLKFIWAKKQAIHKAVFEKSALKMLSIYTSSSISSSESSKSFTLTRWEDFFGGSQICVLQVHKHGGNLFDHKYKAPIFYNVGLYKYRGMIYTFNAISYRYSQQ